MLYFILKVMLHQMMGVHMNSQEISKLWFKCYGEDLKTEYSGFYNKLTKLEKTINEEEDDGSTHE